MELFISDLKKRLESLLLPWKNMIVLEELKRVPPLSNYPMAEFVDREEAMAAWDAYVEGVRSVAESHRRVPMAAVACGPGGGKSRLVNTIAESKTADTYYPIAVTFNFFYKRGALDKDYFWELCKRALFS